jgi:hypothetical protein
MLSEKERIENAEWENKYRGISGGETQSTTVLPVFQAEILNSTKNDPLLQRFGPGNPSDPERWFTTIATFDIDVVVGRCFKLHSTLSCLCVPHRKAEVESSFSMSLLQGLPKEGQEPKKPSLRDHLSLLVKPSMWKGKLIKAFVATFIDPSGRVADHMFANIIFDGDGIFLHKQGKPYERIQSHIQRLFDT